MRAEQAAETVDSADAHWRVTLWPSGAHVPSTYAALTLTSPFVDRCGLEYDEESARHELLGILELGGEK